MYEFVKEVRKVCMITNVLKGNNLLKIKKYFNCIRILHSLNNINIFYFGIIKTFLSKNLVQEKPKFNS